MGARSASSKLGRGREVVPIIDDDGNDTGYSPLDKPNRRHSSNAAPRRRMLLTRGWLGFFLLLNIFAIAGFIFSSAWYFPATTTTGVVEQAIKQGDLSLLEIPGRKDPQGNGVAEPRETAEATTTKPVATAEEVTLTSEPPHQPPSEEPTTHLSSEIKSPTGNLNPVSTAAVVATTSLPPSTPAQTSPDQVAPVSSDDTKTEPASVTEEDGIDRHAVAGIEAQQPLETTPPPTSETTTPSMSVVRSQSMEELLRRMKGTQPPSILPTDREQATPAPAKKQDDELVQEDTQTAARGMLDEEYLPDDTRAALAEDKGLETNLVVWLKADAGVEVANAAECEALGTACEVTSWKSVVPPGSGSDPIMFKPVNSRMQPVLQPASQNDLSTVSFSCGMTHTNGFQLHDMMTLFFVLSPSQIEAGDSYAAQKFFGNAPYGQFLLHGGRPSFFTASGLVESSVSVKNDQLVLVAYRLHRHAVEIKVGDVAWSPKQAEADGFQLRLSGNAALSLGNVKGVCDTNAFQGRIAEVLIYDAVLSDHRVDVVERYLLQRWWGTTPPPRDEKPEGDGTKHPRMDSEEPIVQPTKDAQANPETEAAPSSHEPIDSKQPEMSDQPRSEETDQPRLGGTDQPLEESQTTNPRAFDPEGVFEWLPSPELLALIAKEQGSDPSPLVEKWKLAVSDKIASVRNFQFGSDILRSFIRERRDELLKLREELFGG